MVDEKDEWWSFDIRRGGPRGLIRLQQINNLTSVAKCYFLMTSSSKANDAVTHAHHPP